MPAQLQQPLAFIFSPGRLFGADAPSNKLNIAGIGVGSMGDGNIRACSTENIVALCDVDDKYAEHTFSKYPKAVKYGDYRVMLEKQKDIDAVVTQSVIHTTATAADTFIVRDGETVRIKAGVLERVIRVSAAMSPQTGSRCPGHHCLTARATNCRSGSPGQPPTTTR